MICPSCQYQCAAPVRSCPRCGTRITQLKSGFIKTSAVLIASNDRRMVYSSVRDVPEPLRKRLEACTTGKNSGTIVIADRRGKEEMEKAARFSRVAQTEASGGRRVRWNHVWPALVAMTIGAAGAWLAFLARW